MKLLVLTFYQYAGDPRGIEPQYYYLCKVPEAMGHEVDFLDYHYQWRIGPDSLRRIFLSLVKNGNYAAVFIATHRNEFDRETLESAKRYSTTIAWNSDDEWRWDSYSRERLGWYSFMVTNSRTVYEKYHPANPTLLHAQWACTGFWDGRQTRKDIDFSFVGQVYASRRRQIAWLARKAGLVAYGRGSGNLGARAHPGADVKSRLKQFLWTCTPRAVLPSNVTEHLSTLSFDEVNQLWNRTRVSFTPLESSTGETLQIKSRVFDMGLSGTVMLAPHLPELDFYYEPHKEYIPFTSLEDAADKARRYLADEAERRRIADAYARRTLAEHLWKHRIDHVLREAGLA